MRVFLWVIALVLLGAMLAGCGKPPAVAGARHDLVADMVGFDRLLVPAVLRCASPEDDAPAMAAVSARWEILKTRYADALQTDADAKADFARLDAALSAAAAATHPGARYLALDDARSALRALRQRRGITYYLDALVTYHQHLARLARLLAGKSADTLTVDDEAALTRELPVLASLWEDTAQAPCDAALYGFTPADTAALHTAQATETAALRALQQALDTRDKPLILQRATAAIAAFNAVYGLFGG